MSLLAPLHWGAPPRRRLHLDAPLTPRGLHQVRHRVRLHGEEPRPLRPRSRAEVQLDDIYQLECLTPRRVLKAPDGGAT